MNEGLEALKYISKQLETNLVNNNYLQTIEQELKEKEEIADALSRMSYQCGNLLRYKSVVEVLKKCPQIGDILDWAEQYDEVNNTCIYGLLKDVLL